MREDRFGAGTKSTSHVMSREQAIRKTELSNDRQWVQQFLAGGAAERRDQRPRRDHRW